MFSPQKRGKNQFLLISCRKNEKKKNSKQEDGAPRTTAILSESKLAGGMCHEYPAQAPRLLKMSSFTKDLRGNKKKSLSLLNLWNLTKLVAID
ncbi:hypothetical protein VNO80_24742 [Phaseolus coccineus]|uniref:Uncharacterized protein n=1 Tax=Phaseolus coccineus TaxID=3886 RepID=A0AAN9LX88_PHACN